MKRKQFKQLINLLDEQQQSIDKAYAIDIDILEFMNPMFTANEILFKEAFGEEAAEWISWFMYEKDFGRREDLGAWDEDKTEICRTVDELYDYIKSLKKKKSKKDRK